MLFVWLIVPLNVLGFYLPGVAPHDYSVGDNVPLLVNSLGAVDDLLNYDYYYPSFHFCKPKGGEVSQRESLGSILFGDRLYSSPFTLSFLQNTTCASACDPVNIPADDAQFINQRIMENYMHNWEVDGLPAAQYEEETGFYSSGFDLGVVLDELSYLNNHFDIMIHYHAKSESRFRVVGVLVSPRR
jgi:transmembrane 9 superfamily protein 2/4